MKYFYIFILIFAVFSCKDHNINDCGCTKLFYYNSFESDSDLKGWNNLQASNIKDEHPPYGGSHSILVGGGCIQPTAYIKLPVTESGYYSLSCWGKSFAEHNSGQIKLRKNVESDTAIASISIDSTAWLHYSSIKTTHFTAGDTATIEFWVGGIKQSQVYIDELTVERIH